MDNRYQMLKQFMHNELKITKEEIREWVREATEQAAKTEFARMFQQTNMNEKFREIAQAEFAKVMRDGSSYNGRDSTVSKAVAEKLAAHIWAHMQIKFVDAPDGTVK